MRGVLIAPRARNVAPQLRCFEEHELSKMFATRQVEVVDGIVVPKIAGAMPNPYASPLLVDLADGTQILNSTAEAIICPDFAFLAGDARLYQGAAFEIYCSFDVSNVVTTPGTLTFRVRWGGVAGTVLCASDAIALDTVARTSYGGELRVRITWRSIGAAGSAFAQGSVVLTDIPAISSPPNKTAPPFMMGSAGSAVPAVVSSLDTTTAKALSVTAQFSVATATTQLTNHQRHLLALAS